MKKIILMVVALFLGLMFMAGPASAVDEPGPKITRPGNFVPEKCVPHDAWTETIEHPEVSHIVHHDAVTETIHHPAETHVVHHDAVTEERTVIDSPAVWANWVPNETQGPQDYTPVWPTDERGTWIVHNQLPPGHEGPNGVYQQGGGNSPWFYRQAEVSHVETVIVKEAYDEVVIDKEAWDEVKVITEAYDETVIDEEAWTETIEHPAVVCEDVIFTNDEDTRTTCAGTYYLYILTEWHRDPQTGEYFVFSKSIEQDGPYGKDTCPVDEPPVDNPPKTTPDKPEPPKSIGTPKRASATPNNAVLPATGGPMLGYAVAGAASVAGGIVLLWKRRKF